MRHFEQYCFNFTTLCVQAACQKHKQAALIMCFLCGRAVISMGGAEPTVTLASTQLQTPPPHDSIMAKNRGRTSMRIADKVALILLFVAHTC